MVSPADEPARSPSLRHTLSVWTLGGMEALVLLMVVLSPWAFGSIDPEFQYYLYAALAALLALWALRVLLQWRVSWKRCPVALCLGALCLFGMWQVMPLPRPVLGVLAPQTAGLYDRLLPSQHETLPSEVPIGAPAAGNTLSVYAEATRTSTVQLLAVFALFIVVRNNFASTASLGRLSIVCAINGTLLALFALVQFFSSGNSLVYWTFPTDGHVFGPFVCRNHFPYYVNMCAGLGLGLLVAGNRGSTAEDGKLQFRKLLHEPQNLWISVGLAVMVSSVLFSLSRGGFVALLGAAVVCVLARRRHSARRFGLEAGIVTIAMALGLLAWFGLDVVEKRLSTFWESRAMEDRAPLWSDVLPAVLDFPVWGSGLGTFAYVEPMRRTSTWLGPAVVCEHAHNDYLEAVLEGGLVRLVLGLAAIFFVYRLGFRAVRRRENQPAAGLAVGGLFGFTAVVIHSIGDFGLHIPAIVILATVLCAQLCNLGDPRHKSAPAAGNSWLGTLAPPIVAGLLVLLGLVLYGQGWRADKLERLQLAAARLRTSGDAAQREREVYFLNAAARMAPQNAVVHLELGHAHRDLSESARKKSPGAATEADHLTPALLHFVAARDLCPLMTRAHVRIANYRDHFLQADERAFYLERANFLAPADPELWYLCGLEELKDGQQDRAWNSFRQSLIFSKDYLEKITFKVKASKLIGPQEMLDRVLPKKPGIVRQAGEVWFPSPEEAPKRRPFLERALSLLEEETSPLTAEDLYERAMIQRALDRPTDALASFKSALRLKPRATRWRFEYADLLCQQQQWAEARREVILVLDSEPNDPKATQLLKSIIAGKLAVKH